MAGPGGGGRSGRVSGSSRSFHLKGLCLGLTCKGFRVYRVLGVLGFLGFLGFLIMVSIYIYIYIYMALFRAYL